MLPAEVLWGSLAGASWTSLRTACWAAGAASPRPAPFPHGRRVMSRTRGTAPPGWARDPRLIARLIARPGGVRAAAAVTSTYDRGIRPLSAIPQRNALVWIVPPSAGGSSDQPVVLGVLSGKQITVRPVGRGDR